MKITSCRFERAVTRAGNEPDGAGPDLIFVGRSNVGKSSLINRLLGVTGLARTSSTPGRTQSINFYRINEAFWFVDLPGYGFARVPLAVREAWKPMVDGYLTRRGDRIAVAILVVDARREPPDSDLEMRDWLQAAGIPYVVSATKTDKLSGNLRARAAAALGRAYASPLLVSGKTGAGLRDVWRHIDRSIEAMKERKQA